MTPRSIFLFCLLVSAHSSADPATGREADTDELNSAILRKTFEEPLYTELVRGGLAPLLAVSETDRLLDALEECWKSDLNETNWEEPTVTSFWMGGQFIQSYETPCLEAFLIAVKEAKP